MNVLFMCLSKMWDINGRGIYPDLLREFIKRNAEVYVVSPIERRYDRDTELIEHGKAHILKVKTLNIQKTNAIEKGLGTVWLEYQFTNAIKKYFAQVHFDLVLYATPPITLVKPIKYVKTRDHAQTYLLLKDIFPQNAVDIGMMRTTGLKGILYKLFRRKEKQLYSLSDRIGCMSQANVDYVLKHNPEILPDKVEICPNSIEFEDISVTAEERAVIRGKFGLPQDKKVFIYGGNLGKPQGIPFLIECLRAEKEDADVCFLVIGDGTEYGKLESFAAEESKNMRLMKRLPKEDYDVLVAACDVGMIFLDHRFTIPNFPSRLIGYLQAGIPVLACTDPNTDIGDVITEGGFGWWCESNDTAAFRNCVARAKNADLKTLGKNGSDYLREHYSVDIAFHTIINEGQTNESTCN